MFVPEAVNMPPTPRQTEILVPESERGRYRASGGRSPLPYVPECMLTEAAAINAKQRSEPMDGNRIRGERAGRAGQHFAKSGLTLPDPGRDVSIILYVSLRAINA